MTKTIRIENADNSQFKVVVEVWNEEYVDFLTKKSMPAELVRTINLDYPTSMTPPDLYITDTKYLVIREIK